MSASNNMPEFHDFINYSALVDLQLRGGDFPWSRSSEATTLLHYLFWVASLLDFY